MLKRILGFLSGSGGSGGGGEPQPSGDPVEYKGFTIVAMPAKDANGWRVNGKITKETDDGLKEHQFIRADTNGDLDTVTELTITKAQRIIDEQGERIFEPRR